MKAPIVKSRYGGSLKALHSTRGPALLGFSRGLIRTNDVTEKRSATNPQHLTAQAKPTWGIRYCIIDGNTILPRPVPMAEQARASVRLFLKYELATDRGGMNMVPSPRPIHTPWDKKKCQYWVPKLVMKV